jgi:hypothetical protein
VIIGFAIIRFLTSDRVQNLQSFDNVSFMNQTVSGEKELIKLVGGHKSNLS